MDRSGCPIHGCRCSWAPHRRVHRARRAAARRRSGRAGHALRGRLTALPRRAHRSEYKKRVKAAEKDKEKAEKAVSTAARAAGAHGDRRCTGAPAHLAGLPASPPPQAKKAAEAAAKPAAPKKAALLDDSAEELDPTLYFENRVKYVEGRKGRGLNPYPHKFPVTTTVPEFVEKYANLEAGEQLKDVTVALAGGPGPGFARLRAVRGAPVAAVLVACARPAGVRLRASWACRRGAAPSAPCPCPRGPQTRPPQTPTPHPQGRVFSKRASGSKLLFYDLRGEGAKVQVMADARNADVDEDAFFALHNEAKRGDIVGVEGFPGKSQKGELSVFPVKFSVLAPCLHMPPGRTGLTNQVGGGVGLGALGCMQQFAVVGASAARGAASTTAGLHCAKSRSALQGSRLEQQQPLESDPLGPRPRPWFERTPPPPPPPAGDALPPALPGPDEQPPRPGHLLHARADHPVRAQVPRHARVPGGKGGGVESAPGEASGSAAARVLRLGSLVARTVYPCSRVHTAVRVHLSTRRSRFWAALVPASVYGPLEGG